MNVIDKIRACDTMPKLDNLRLEIVKDKKHFLENQKIFIKQKNKLKRISPFDRDW